MGSQKSEGGSRNKNRRLGLIVLGCALACSLSLSLLKMSGNRRCPAINLISAAIMPAIPITKLNGGITPEILPPKMVIALAINSHFFVWV